MNVLKPMELETMYVLKWMRYVKLDTKHSFH